MLQKWWRKKWCRSFFALLDVVVVVGNGSRSSYYVSNEAVHPSVGPSVFVPEAVEVAAAAAAFFSPTSFLTQSRHGPTPGEEQSEDVKKWSNIGVRLHV